jgi:hypothetical protein
VPARAQLVPPREPAWDDLELPVVPSRARNMRRYRKGSKEWLPIALTAGGITAFVVIVMLVSRLLLAK